MIIIVTILTKVEAKTQQKEKTLRTFRGMFLPAMENEWCGYDKNKN